MPIPTRPLSLAIARVSSRERHALAAALIAGTILIGVLHAPVGAVLGGCSMALAALYINSRRKRR